ncbi:MAG: alkaline phosphatase family protein [Gammaproteobacteria bacterium]
MESHDPIQHVIVLLMENHSFDQMLGCFKQLYPALEGVDPKSPHSNADDAGAIYTQMPTTERQMPLDPNHEVPHVAVQLADNNGGFVKDFARSFQSSSQSARQFIMGYYPLDFLPTLHALAREFTICDHWHASLPGPTWPNRFFALSGTSNGRVNMPDDGTTRFDLKGYFQQTQDTLFDRLNERGIHWKVYFHDIPQTTVFSHQREPHNAARYFYIDEFYDDARGAEQAFPQFAFIEPRYLGWEENDDHPPHDIMCAEKLIADVYNAVRSNDPLWRSTLLVVFYDEHGGFYDHVVPGPAIPPDGHQEEYSFDRLGVRVPALLMSPWVERRVETTLFDHTSLLKYLTEKWDLGPLGERTANATSIGVGITRTSPRTDTISRIELTAAQLAPPDPESEEKACSHFNPHQMAMARLTGYLKDEALSDLPIVYACVSRAIEWARARSAWLLRFGHDPISKINVSISEPDKLAHHMDLRPRDEFASFLMIKKRIAVSRIARVLRNESIPQAQRQHALQTLSLITARKYPQEPDGMENAKSWLGRHGH